MSDVPSDPTAMTGTPGEGGEPSEEEIRAYLGQLRVAPVDQVLAEVSSALVNAAQVKLGRKDGRLLLDVVAAITDQVRGRVDENLTTQLDDVLSQLRLAQVEGEKEVEAAAAQGHQEPGDLGSDPSAPSSEGEATGAPATPPQPAPPAGGDAASRLWTPGT